METTLNRIAKLAAAIAILAAPAVALAQHDHSQHDMSGMTEADKALMDAHMKMMKDMEMKPTGDPDRDFVTMMIPHHQGAVDMAKIQLKYGKDPELRKLAEEIVASQEREISQMESWRKRNAE
jgi:uncharacterized protein (DUF305 family)